MPTETKQEKGKAQDNGYMSKRSFFSEAFNARRFKDENVPSFGMVRIRSLNDGEYTEIQSASIKSDGTIDKLMAQTFNVRMIVMCVVNATGNRIFSDQDVPKLREMDAGIIDAIAKHCRDWIGIRTEEEVKNG